MIPRILHYVWLGGREIPATLQAYMATWQQKMPSWTIMAWTEETIAEYCKQNNLQSPIFNLQYCAEAYAARKYAFASDYIRLWALEQYGGVYLDTDVEVIRSFDNLPEFNLQSLISNLQSPICNLQSNAFISFEESLAHLPGTCVMGCEPHCRWVKDMLATYDNVSFIVSSSPSGESCGEAYDLTTNVMRLGKAMIEKYGLIPNGKEQICNLQSAISNHTETLHVYPHAYFSPITSTRVMRKTKDTFAIHHFAGSWSEQKGVLNKLKASPFACEIINLLVQMKRWIKGQK